MVLFSNIWCGKIIEGVFPLVCIVYASAGASWSGFCQIIVVPSWHLCTEPSPVGSVPSSLQTHRTRMTSGVSGYHQRGYCPVRDRDLSSPRRSLTSSCRSPGPTHPELSLEAAGVPDESPPLERNVQTGSHYLFGSIPSG